MTDQQIREALKGKRIVELDPGDYRYGIRITLDDGKTIFLWPVVEMDLENAVIEFEVLQD